MAELRCSRCGCYDYVHDPDYKYFGTHVGHRFRRASALRLWFRDHSLIRHARSRLWLARPSRSRWHAAERLYAARPDLCWCDMAFACVQADWADEDGWRRTFGDLCDVSTPTEATVAEPGRCYCIAAVPSTPEGDQSHDMDNANL